MQAQTENHLQINFLNQVKNILPPSISLAEELSDLLVLSTDSVYRRIRGETALTFTEISQICNKYKISFDLFSGNTENITFYYDSMYDSVGFQNYLGSILNDMLQIQQAQNKKIVYSAIDVPIFHHFNYPALSAFKMFYWMKGVISAPSLLDKKFSVEHISPELAEIGKKIYNTYVNIPSDEIWTDETINSLIKQVEFFWDSGHFADKEDALTVCQQAMKEVETLEKQAELSSKVIDESGTSDNEFNLYHSEIEIGNNYILTQKAEIKVLYISVHTFNKIITLNRKFINETKMWLENLKKKSVLISGISQKHRYKFFKGASAKVERLFDKIKNE